MKRSYFTVALAAGILCASSAFADRWVEPINGTLSTIMAPDGDVMMKVQLPPKEFAAISGMMAAKHDTCTVFHMTDGGVPDSLILVCGASRDYIPNY
jgi:hypothetical protein